MNNLLIALLLLELSQRRVLVAIGLYLNYLIYAKKKDTKPVCIDIKKLAKQVGLDVHRTAESMEKLVNYNVVGSVVLETVLEKKKVVRGLNERFINSLDESRRGKPLTNAVARTNYYVTYDAKVYVFNPNMLTWMYPSKDRALKIANNFKKNLDSEIIKHILDINKNKKPREQADKNELNAPRLLSLFIGKFTKIYGQEYDPNWTIESAKMKNLILQFERNSVAREEIPEFFDWAFEKIAGQDRVLSVAFLRSLANEYLASGMVHRDSRYVVDEYGRRKLKKDR